MRGTCLRVLGLFQPSDHLRLQQFLHVSHGLAEVVFNESLKVGHLAPRKPGGSFQGDMPLVEQDQPFV
jgi:hypothetical protein